MFAFDLSFSKAIMAARRAERSHGAPRRVVQQPAQRPTGRQAATVRGR